MPIEAKVTSSQIAVNVGESKIDVSVGGGVGPTGSQGSSGVVTVSAPLVNGGTASAAQLSLSVGSGLQVSGGSLALASHTHTASQITDFTAAVVAAAPPTTDASLLTSGTVASARLPIASAGSLGAVRIGSGVSVDPATGVISVSAASVAWNDITGKPTFATVATSGSYNDLTNKPSLFDGSYASLSNVPSTFTPSSHTHGNITNDGKVGSDADKVLVTTSAGAVTATSSITFSQVASTSTYTNFSTTPGDLGGALSGIDSAIGDRALASHTHDSLTGANSSLMCDDNIIAIVADGIYLNGTQIVPYQIGTTSGLIVKTGTTGVLETLAQGTAGQVLVVNSGATAMEWKTLAAADVGAASLSHTHSAGDVTAGSTAGLVIVTTTGGALSALTQGTAGQVLKVNSGATGVEWGAAAADVSIDTTAADILSASSGSITADDPGADRIVFWDDSASKLTHLEVGTNLAISGTTLSASGGPTNVWIPASAFIPRTTNGCGVDSRETSTNRTNWDELLFDAGADEFAQAAIVMPSNYNAGTITARFYWTASGATDGSDDVIWGIQARAFANDDALDTAFGTAQTVTDTVIATNDMHVSSATSAVTAGGTPAANVPLLIQIYRDADAAGDTYGHDARLLGVEIIYTAA